MSENKHVLLVCAFTEADHRREVEEVMEELTAPGVREAFNARMEERASAHNLSIVHYAEDSVIMEGAEEDMLALVEEIGAQHMTVLHPKRRIMEFAAEHAEERRKFLQGKQPR